MPTHRSFPDNKQDPITLKNLVKQTEERLLAQMDKREVWPIMEVINHQEKFALQHPIGRIR